MREKERQTSRGENARQGGRVRASKTNSDMRKKKERKAGGIERRGEEGRGGAGMGSSLL